MSSTNNESTISSENSNQIITSEHIYPTEQGQEQEQEHDKPNTSAQTENDKTPPASLPGPDPNLIEDLTLRYIFTKVLQEVSGGF
jgi:hypothetical protein